MALLTEQELDDLWNEDQRVISKIREAIDVTRPQGRAVYTAMDQWFEDNAASLNSAIPQPQRGALTTKMKYRIFKSILNKRVENL